LWLAQPYSPINKGIEKAEFHVEVSDEETQLEKKQSFVKTQKKKLCYFSAKKQRKLCSLEIDKELNFTENYQFKCRHLLPFFFLTLFLHSIL
jgi:hypothetical protein